MPDSSAVINSPEATANTVVPDGAPMPKRSWLDGFRRITTSGEVIPEIDGLRFIAIAAVVWCHLGVIAALAAGHHLVTDLGSNGVPLFFVISGFVLARPFAAQYRTGGKPVQLRRYFVRRLTRLEPPYLLSLLILLFLKMLRDPTPDPYLPKSFLASLFYAHGFMYGYPSRVSVIAWSLEVEIQFYLLMPILAGVFLIPSRWGRRAVMAGVALAVMWFQPIKIPSLMYPNDEHVLNSLQFFLAGLLLADVYVIEWGNQSPALRTGAIAWGDLVWLVGWPLLAWLMRIPLIVTIGGMCYSIYLLHNTVLQGVGRPIIPILPTQHTTLSMFMCTLLLVPPVLIVCGLYFRLIERPCMRPDWPRRLWKWFVARLFVESADEREQTT
jgi:peptidoglycan/LPS O-acetylase OafA/YrhL